MYGGRNIARIVEPISIHFERVEYELNMDSMFLTMLRNDVHRTASNYRPS